MNWNKQLDLWGEKQRSAFMLGLRILLGLILLIKGYLFMFRINDLSEVVTAMKMGSFNVTLALIIAWSHMLGGLAIICGILTRISCVIQFPILVGAVFYVNLRQGFITNTDWILSVVILYLLVFFFVYGSGEHSLANLFEGREGEDAIPSRENK
ncbi:MAG TPA: DoxX family protein [Chitinophagales bacterium]|nr:DoxX family protein [Chitinophagales bacterium]